MNDFNAFEHPDRDRVTAESIASIDIAARQPHAIHQHDHPVAAHATDVEPRVAIGTH